MTRILILIFAFNAFFTPVSATAACVMMDGENMSMMSESNMANNIIAMSSSMDGMNCNKDLICSSAKCVSNCTSTITPLLSSEDYSLISVAGHLQPSAGFAYFYKITYPVNTPPPLV